MTTTLPNAQMCQVLRDLADEIEAAGTPITNLTLNVVSPTNNFGSTNGQPTNYKITASTPIQLEQVDVTINKTYVSTAGVVAGSI